MNWVVEGHNEVQAPLPPPHPFLCPFLVSWGLPSLSLLNSPTRRKLRTGMDSRHDKTHTLVIDGVLEAQRGERSCPKSHSKSTADPGSEPKSLPPSLGTSTKLQLIC